MKNKKLLKKIAMGATIIYAAVFVLFILPGLQNPDQIDRNSKIERAVLSLWHVDLFEGGIGSRADFLSRAAVKYEKSHPGTYISVRAVSLTQLTENLAQGNVPDLISYAPGAANMLLPHLFSFEGTLSAYENLIDAGTVDGKLFAVPWSAGGYIAAAQLKNLPQDPGEGGHDYARIITSSAISLKKGVLPSFVYGSSQYNLPLLSVIAANSAARLGQNSLNLSLSLTQSEAYYNFISGGSVFLLGTQRDAVKLSQRENSSDYGMQALGGFNDLICYISLSNNSYTKQATGFIEYLLSPEVQRTVTAINMLSVNLSGLYTEGIMQELEQELPKSYALGAFIQPASIDSLRVTSLSALGGDGESLNYIKQLLAN